VRWGAKPSNPRPSQSLEWFEKLSTLNTRAGGVDIIELPYENICQN
jgi:hypothetical protein